jgi:hypothetical protein
MPLLYTKQIDRELLNLNQNAYGIYFEDVEKKGSHPLSRWCRNFERMKSISVYDFGEQTVGYATYKRDENLLAGETLEINNLLRHGAVVLFPLEEWSRVERDLAKSSPQLYERLSHHITSWRNL